MFLHDRQRRKARMEYKWTDFSIGTSFLCEVSSLLPRLNRRMDELACPSDKIPYKQSGRLVEHR